MYFCAEKQNHLMRTMNKILSAIVTVLVFTSCSTAYNVQGSSSVTALDGSKLYLKTVKDQNIKSLDSCDVVHGKFYFSGVLDTVRIASIFMDDESIMPVVLEDGEITIQIDHAKQTVSGTALNDTLYKFIDLFNQLDNRMNELGHKQNQMILEGIDENIIMEEVGREADKIAAEREQLMTKSITENFNNVLGPYFFEMLTSIYRYPVLTPQIEFIMSKASDKFKRDRYVKEYYETAQQNEKRMQGFDVDDPTVSDNASTSRPSPNDTVQRAPIINVPQN